MFEAKKRPPLEREQIAVSRSVQCYMDDLISGQTIQANLPAVSDTRGDLIGWVEYEPKWA